MHICTYRYYIGTIIGAIIGTIREGQQGQKRDNYNRYYIGTIEY
jgi:hypothetical protein